MPYCVKQHQLHRQTPARVVVMSQTFNFAFATDLNNLLVSFTFTTLKPAQTNSKINHSGEENCWKTCWKLTNAFSPSLHLCWPLSIPFLRYSSAWQTGDFLHRELPLISLCPLLLLIAAVPASLAHSLPSFPQSLQISSKSPVPVMFLPMFKCSCPVQVQGEAQGLHPKLQHCSVHLTKHGSAPTSPVTTNRPGQEPHLDCKTGCFGHPH